MGSIYRGGIVALIVALGAISPSAKPARIVDCHDLEKLGKGPQHMELSGISYVGDSNILYAVGDAGMLLAYEPEFANGRLVNVRLLKGTSLLDKNSMPLSGEFADSEGLVAQYADDGVAGNTVLWVSFERQPRACRYKVDGTLMDCPRLPDSLVDIGNYQGANSALESIAITSDMQIVVAAERALKIAEAGTGHGIYALDGGSVYQLARHNQDAGLSGMEAMPDGRWLLLERSYNWWRFAPRVDLLSYSGISTGSKPQVLLSADLGSLPKGNFEAIGRHDGKHIFMASDDNDLPFTATWLLYIALDEMGQNAACE